MTARPLPRALRGALSHVAAAGELEHLETLRDEPLEVYARDSAAMAHAGGNTDLLASDLEDLAAWLRSDRPRRDAVADLLRGGRTVADLRRLLSVALHLADGALAILETRRIEPERTRAIRAAYVEVVCRRNDTSR